MEVTAQSVGELAREWAALDATVDGCEGASADARSRQRLHEERQREVGRALSEAAFAGGPPGGGEWRAVPAPGGVLVVLCGGGPDAFTPAVRLGPFAG